MSNEGVRNSENITSQISINNHNNNNRHPTFIEPSPHVCRNLFGSESTALNENIENALYESLRADRTARERWNFDFENEQPLPGKWQWEKVTNEESSPTSITNISNVSTDISSTNPDESKHNCKDLPDLISSSNESIQTDYIELSDNDVSLQS